MLLFYVRHGHPTYTPNKLTSLGRRQAEAVGRRLALFGVDKIYASTSNRAMETAQPTCDMLLQEKTLLDYANENLAFRDFSMKLPDGRALWVFAHPEARKMFCDPEVLALGHEWYTHPFFQEFGYKKGVDRIRKENDAFFASLGYERIPGQGAFKAVAPNDDRVALFAHQGFGIAFLSDVLNIPYSQFSIHFDLSHSGLTVIEFPNEGEISIPRICTLSSDAHLYKEGLPTLYNFRFRY